MSDTLRLRFGPFELDEREARLLRGREALAVTPKAFAVLCALARRPGQLVLKDQLLDAVWGHQFVSDSVLKTTVSDLRALLGDDAKQPRIIETASRRGYRFIAPLQAQEAAAAPAFAALPQSGQPALVGRDAAHQRLHGAWQAAASGRRQIVWVAGEAGIGKTTLIEHFVAAQGDARVVHGQCVEQHGAGEPYLPVLEALATLCRHDDALPALLHGVAPTWLLQMPWLSTPADLAELRQQLAGSGQERMLREFGELIDRLTHERPLLLVSEDLHWSDQATLRLIDHVARRRAPARLMWLASYRLAEVVATDHPLKALRHELRLHRLADEIVLDPFSESEVAQLLARRWPGRAASEAQARALHARTDGLPLFLANVLDDIASRGDPAAELDELVHDAPPVPESLAGVVEQQIARLAPDDRALLEAASVCGVEFDASTLADAAQRDAADVGERCEALARRQQWLAGAAIDRSADGGLVARWTFRHALYRQVFYQRLGGLARAQLHRRIGESMQRRQAVGTAVPPAQLALHFELGREPATALRHYAAAAESALRHFAPAEALALTERALGLLPQCPDGRERTELELALLGPRGVAASQVHGVTTKLSRSVFERIDALAELLPDQVAGTLALAFGWSLFVGGEHARALAIAQRKLALAQERGDRVLEVAACNLCGATLAYLGELGAARDWLERGIAAAQGLGTQLAGVLAVIDLEVSLRSRLSQVLAHLGHIEPARAQLSAAAARADALGQPYARRLVLIFEAFLDMRLARPERVLAAADALQRIATGHGMAQAEGDARWFRGWALVQQGRPGAGLALIREGYALDLAAGMLRGRSAVLGYAAEALVAMQRWDEARTQLDAAFALAARTGERMHLPELHLVAARVARGHGDIASARAALARAREEAARQQAPWLEQAAATLARELEAAVPDDPTET